MVMQSLMNGLGFVSAALRWQHWGLCRKWREMEQNIISRSHWKYWHVVTCMIHNRMYCSGQQCVMDTSKFITNFTAWNPETDFHNVENNVHQPQLQAVKFYPVKLLK